MTFTVDESKLKQHHAKPQRHSWPSRIFVGIPVALMVSFAIPFVVCLVLSLLIGAFAFPLFLVMFAVMLPVTVWSVLFGKANIIKERKQ